MNLSARYNATHLNGCNFTMIFNENYTLQERCDMIDCSGSYEILDFIKIFNCTLNQSKILYFMFVIAVACFIYKFI